MSKSKLTWYGMLLACVTAYGCLVSYAAYQSKNRACSLAKNIQTECGWWSSTTPKNLEYLAKRYIQKNSIIEPSDLIVDEDIPRKFHRSYRDKEAFVGKYAAENIGVWEKVTSSNVSITPNFTNNTASELALAEVQNTEMLPLLSPGTEVEIACSTNEAITDCGRVSIRALTCTQNGESLLPEQSCKAWIHASKIKRCRQCDTLNIDGKGFTYSE